MAWQLISSHSGPLPLDGREERSPGRERRRVEVRACFQIYMANRIRNATIRQNRPIASDRAKPRMA